MGSCCNAKLRCLSSLPSRKNSGNCRFNSIKDRPSCHRSLFQAYEFAMHFRTSSCDVTDWDVTVTGTRYIYSGRSTWNLWWQDMEYHISTSLAIMMMRFDATAQDHSPEPIRTYCEDFRNRLHEREPDHL